MKEEALLAENQASIQRLVADSAARHAESQLAKLQNKIETLELQVGWSGGRELKQLKGRILLLGPYSNPSGVSLLCSTLQ